MTMDGKSPSTAQFTANGEGFPNKNRGLGDGEDKDHGFIRDFWITRKLIADLARIMGLRGWEIMDLIGINGFNGHPIRVIRAIRVQSAINFREIL